MDKKRNYALEERLLQKHLVPQFPKGLPPSYGERIAFKAGMDAAEELYRPLLEAVEKLSKGNRSPGVLAIAREALEAVRKVVEK